MKSWSSVEDMRNFASLTKFDSQSFSIKENVLYIYHSKHIREIPNPQHSSIGLDSLYPAYSSVQFTHSVMSDSLRPHGLQHARPPSPSTAPRVYSNSCPLSRWCHPSGDLIFCHPLLLLPSIFSSTRVFSNEPGLHIRWPKYWSFSISPQWFSRLISFRIHWLDFLQSKELSRVFSNATVQKHLFFGAQLSCRAYFLHLKFFLVSNP